jgi:tungstate transport system ATP-binding protein
VIELKKITKCYGPMVAIESLSLSIHEGKILGLMGPNGSGKTTILRLIALLEELSSGLIEVNGEQIKSVNHQRLRQDIGFLFEQSTVFSGSTKDNVTYPLRLRGYPDSEIESRVSNALKKVRLTGFEDRPANTLSAGEAQRMGLARILVYSPAIFLFDEPTANLDPYNAGLIEEVLKNLRAEGKIVVVVTHDVFQARRLADFVAFILMGNLVEYGSAEQLFQSPCDPRTAAFIRGEMVY